MALVITLSILALLSILLVSFVSMALLDRGATASYSQSLPADQIAQGGLDQIISQFQAEISDRAFDKLPADEHMPVIIHSPGRDQCRAAAHRARC